MKGLTDDPIGWLGTRLDDLDGVLRGARVPGEDIGADDVEGVRAAGPQIVDAVTGLLSRIRAGELARPPVDTPLSDARVSWL